MRLWFDTTWYDSFVLSWRNTNGRLTYWGYLKLLRCRLFLPCWYVLNLPRFLLEKYRQTEDFDLSAASLRSSRCYRFISSPRRLPHRWWSGVTTSHTENVGIAAMLALFVYESYFTSAMWWWSAVIRRFDYPDIFVFSDGDSPLYPDFWNQGFVEILFTLWAKIFPSNDYDVQGRKQPNPWLPGGRYSPVRLCAWPRPLKHMTMIVFIAKLIYNQTRKG